MTTPLTPSPDDALTHSAGSAGVLASQARQPTTWQDQLKQSYTQLEELVADHYLPASAAASLAPITQRFKIRITPYYASLMSASPHCPIRAQALPQLAEVDPQLPAWAEQWSQDVYQRPVPWHSDAIGDLKRLAVPRLTARYPARVLIHTSSSCAVDCRFCFRKSALNEKEEDLYQGSLTQAFDYLMHNPSIQEAILTGGDPCSLSDLALLKILRQLQAVPSLRSVRFHTRMPVTLPHRFTPELQSILGDAWNFQITLVSHFNHPQELTPLARQTLKQLQRRGITLLNQSVLLKGVNDDLLTLKTLFSELYFAGVIPYYLHHPDWTPGTFHFRIELQTGIALVEQLRGQIPGPALPDYILELPQGEGKISLLGRQTEILARYQDEHMGGALYQWTPPVTRHQTASRSTSQSQSMIRYLDLYPRSSHAPPLATRRLTS